MTSVGGAGTSCCHCLSVVRYCLDEISQYDSIHNLLQDINFEVLISQRMVSDPRSWVGHMVCGRTWEVDPRKS